MSAREALHSSATNEWYTPRAFTEAAAEVMEEISLDPASCERANDFVKASRFFDQVDDGLSRPWYGRVWLNPPYGRGGQQTWTQKLLHEWEERNIKQACCLVNATTDTKWFQPLWGFPICFVSPRIRFIDMNGVQQASPTHANAIVYLGPNIDEFRQVFGRLGTVVHAL